MPPNQIVEQTKHATQVFSEGNTSYEEGDVDCDKAIIRSVSILHFNLSPKQQLEQRAAEERLLRMHASVVAEQHGSEGDEVQMAAMSPQHDAPSAPAAHWQRMSGCKRRWNGHHAVQVMLLTQ